jgi:hypothetical protein
MEAVADFRIMNTVASPLGLSISVPAALREKVCCGDRPNIAYKMREVKSGVPVAKQSQLGREKKV